MTKFELDLTTTEVNVLLNALTKHATNIRRRRGASTMAANAMEAATVNTLKNKIVAAEMTAKVESGVPLGTQHND